jgi:endoglucanase
LDLRRGITTPKQEALMFGAALPEEMSMSTPRMCLALPTLLLTLFGCTSSPDTPAASDAADPMTPDAGRFDTGRRTPDASPAPELQGVLVDDFEDGDNMAVFPGGAWYQYNDTSNGGKSSMSFTGATAGEIVMNGPGFQSARSLEVALTFDQGTLTYPGYVGWGVWFADKGAPFDVSPYVGVAYTYRGAAHRLRIETFEVKDYDFMGMAMPASDDWTTVVVPFSQIAQEGWGAHVTFNPANVGNVSFEARGTTGQKGTLTMDNLMFLTKLPNQDPDMTVNPPDPPTPTPITSIAISNPLQSKAMTYLSRGYNITNWLEDKRFSRFTYDETTVKQLATAGFRSLRLPVDLDLYVASSTGTGETMDIVVHDDLWTVLDSFDQWTANAGMSLTIDYHQYDTSIDKAKPDTITKAVLLWGKVAAHFAASPREDLFYELLNEPELSFAGTPPTAVEWTAMAERMVAAIRAVDTTHTIIFGDVQWYGIAALVQRKPLADSNVIYAIHNYEPFIFTHQGASWANMASTHDVPYPYSAERWSPYFADLGFNNLMPSWIVNAAKGYYRTGNRAALRNLFVPVKQWAVDNNVALIINEFGAYDRSSRAQDRVNYLTDVVSIFEELEIPWQQWFMLMDAKGAVDSEISKALHLGM